MHKYTMFILVSIALLINAYSIELPLYPKDKHHALSPFEIGVEERIVADKHIEFTFKNTLEENDIVLTEGIFVIAPDLTVDTIQVQYILVNNDKQIVRVVDVLDEENPDNLIRFSVTYPYDTEYEYCVFHIKVMLNKIDQQEVIDNNMHTSRTFYNVTYKINKKGDVKNVNQRQLP